MPASDDQLVCCILRDTNRYLDHLQRQRLLWADVDNHIAASHIAEYTGDFALISLHMQAVARLIMEIHRHQPRSARCRKRQRPILMKHRRRYPL